MDEEVEALRLERRGVERRGAVDPERRLPAAHELDQAVR